METRKRILVTRFSALGDVAMVVPVLCSLSEQFPEFDIVFASQGFANPLVKSIPNVSFFKVDLKGRHKGFLGIWRLAKDLKKIGPWFAFVDLHNVLRTKILRIFLCGSVKNVAVIDKGRAEKRALTQRKNKKLIQLKHSVSRYESVFNELRIDVNVQFKKININTDSFALSSLEIVNKGEKWIGVAPFAKHKGKMYPLNLMEQVIEPLSKLSNTKVFLFGGGQEEIEVLTNWENQFDNTTCLAGKIKLDDELRVMDQLDVMLTMDSANMHLASLVGTPVVSVWGATHPFAGFYGWNQNEENAIQINDLSCRPCSVFGNKSCFRKDYACMNQITPSQIVARVLSFL
jgi:ADP-heptose:LPS heptosyltransferase